MAGELIAAYRSLRESCSLILGQFCGSFIPPSSCPIISAVENLLVDTTGSASANSSG
ncbi:conserved hypothetical protein [Ricinus communis]|uniref:Uncharacterized protein n=1 Tax=Ricinus communis TaxID=3988 RepID=B9RWR8_RICCO|nr:conserved hypothetical protein [Ricinus communis]